MSFLSIEFGLCFTLFFIVYWSLCWSARLQNLLLLAASYGLVASFSLNSLYILLGYSALVYLLGLLAGRYPGRRFCGVLLLTLVLGCFYLFKYQAFFVEGVQAALAVVKLFFLSAWLGSEWVDPVFETPGSFTPEQVLLSVYGYSLLIYFNFSGYTNLVTGIALLLGFRLPENFNAPYAAHNLKEFWGRWHISLSRFIRDYVYIPLGGNRKGVWRGNLNMLLAMLVSGLWHGASINFILWGALHGVGLALSKLFSQMLPGFARMPGAGLLARLMTFHYVAFAWIFFRSPTLDGAVEMLGDIAQLSLAGLNSATGLMLLACVLYIATYPQWLAVLRKGFAASQRLPWQLYPVPLGIGVSLVIFASQSGVPGFIYASF